MSRCAANRKPSILLSGFFGRGNCGDEAILQAQYERFSETFDIIVTVDERGAYDGFWNWYPYDRCEIVHQTNFTILREERVIALHLGGGGLPYGYNAGQVVYASSLSKPSYLTGTDMLLPATPKAQAGIGRYLGLFAGVAPRTRASAEIARGLGCSVFEGCDWAFGLRTDASAEAPESVDVLLVLRELPSSATTPAYLASIQSLITALERHLGKVTLLPFCPEDERFVEQLRLCERLAIERHWWNPRRVQQIVSKAALVVSVGRLHPLVFAANVDTAALFVEPSASHSLWPVTTKAQQLCQEHDWSYFHSLETLIKAVPSVHAIFSRTSGVPYDRWKKMADRLEACFTREHS